MAQSYRTVRSFVSAAGPPLYRSLKNIPTSSQPPSLEEFRKIAFVPQKPFHFRSHPESLVTALPAETRWFEPVQNQEPTQPHHPSIFTSYLQSFKTWPVPFEIMVPDEASLNSILSFKRYLQALERETKSDSDKELCRIVSDLIEPRLDAFTGLIAPLELLFQAVAHNLKPPGVKDSPVKVYVAQCSISDLPPELQDDVKTPPLVLQAGRGDVYASSVWLGTEPTYTPLHRDPNPNLFYQLCSRKSVRLLSPSKGDRLFHQVQARLQQTGNSRIRDGGMMQGLEKELMHQLVWESDEYAEDMQHADVGPGDCLFIPKGWWHSIQSERSTGFLNGSVNWWFR